MSEVLLEIKDLVKTYPIKKKSGLISMKQDRMIAVNGISFSIQKGEIYGLVGESGCGKSTIGRTIVGLNQADKGSVLYGGTDLLSLDAKALRPYRKEIQMIFQDTLSSLNPRQRIGKSLEDILTLHNIGTKEDRGQLVLDALKRVGLSEEHYFRYPHELSGGQVQRLGIAGAMIIEPKLIVCDEPVSALDVSIQAQILNMLKDLTRDYALSLLFISHDIGVVRYLSDRIGVMYLGSLMEEAETEELFEKPLHPYTRALFDATPDPYKESREYAALSGEQPVRTKEFKGCAFASRCPYADDRCREEEPTLREVRQGHKVCCHKV